MGSLESGKFLIALIQEKPIEFPLGQNVIEGWDEGIALLRRG
jgi:FKBP-type peptidyl-prolyl cis-trans isomerase